MIAPLKFAVIGLGHIGKRHAEMIRRNPAAELVAVADIRSASETGFSGAEPYFSSLEALLAEHPEVEVVNICVPNGLHAASCLYALDARKHVVCEKPMGLTRASCEAVISKALQVNRQVFTVMQNRYSPPSAWLKEMVNSGRLGKVFMVQINCYWNRDERYYKADTWKGSAALDGGTLFTQFSHFVDIMYWVFGDIQDIQARFADFNHQTLTDFEDSGTVSFEFTDGGMGVINYSTAVWNKNLESSMTVIAENGSLKIGGQYMDVVEYCHVKGYELPELQPTNPANDYGAYKGSANNHHFMIENVIETLRGDTHPTTNALEGMKVVEIIERIYQLKKSPKG